MSQSIEKRCRICGLDVSSQKRTKDAAGNYYCHPCYASAQQPLEAPKPSAAPTASQSQSTTSPSSKSPLVRRAEWTLVIGATALLVLLTSVFVLSGDLGRLSGTVVIPTFVGGLIGFFLLAYTAMWLAKHGSEIKKLGGFASVFANSDRFAFGVKIVGGVVIAASLPIWIVSQARSARSSSDSTPTVQESAPASSLPTIHINDSRGRFHVSNWRLEGYNLVGTAVFSGPGKLDSLEYTSRRNGVVKDRGNVMVPGDVIVKDEPTEITILFFDNPALFDLTIDVNY